MVSEFNQHSPASEFVLQSIARRASEQPEANAIVSGATQITFAELAVRSSALASALHARVEPGSLVAVLTDSAFELIVAALAVWKVGAAYLPISPAAPVERMRHMLQESSTRLIAVSSSVRSSVPDGPWTAVQLDECIASPIKDLAPVANSLAAVETSPDSLAYVIYTSGSTGTPKGVAVTRANLANLVSWYCQAFGVTPIDRVTQIRALTSDVSVMEIWAPLSAGACLHLLDRTALLVAERLRDYLVRHEITICEAPTPIVEELLTLDWPSDTKLRYLQTGGESLRGYPAPGLPFQLVNNYGPTECTVVSTSGIVSPAAGKAAPPSIGRPVSGAEIFILDQQLHPVPDGERGEILIGGRCVAKGYIGRPDLTDERFVTLPLRGASVRVYRTGDLGRKLPAGEIEFCGRLDDQIKLRGYRVEPAEITTALRGHPAVSTAAITSIGEDAYKQLVAYVVLRSDVSAADLRRHLALYLPEYMIPALFVRLETMPRTAHEKIDYRALPFPNRSILMDIAESTLEPTTQLEIEVASIISRVLKHPYIGFSDNFFRLGGNSLLAAQVVVNVQRSFGVDLPVRSVFEAPTVERLSSEIEKQIISASAASAELSGTLAG